MRTELSINGSLDPAASFIAWAPVPVSVRLADASGATAPVAVTLRNQNPAAGGQVVFYSALTTPAQNQLQLSLPVDGSPLQAFIAGQFQRPSTENGDAVVEVATSTENQVLSATPLMVRIRKNANTLTDSERNRFRSAFAMLNNRGTGKYSDFRQIHSTPGLQEAHGNAGFLPWHRSFTLDLERELQRIDPSVALPYWRFDQPAPNVFNPAFMGAANANGNVQFSPDNPLQFWTTDGVPGIIRPPLFNTQTEPAHSQIAVINEAATFALGTSQSLFARFRTMEQNPHGYAHTSFGGYISNVSIAAKDPLFYLLHANVDRLWAKWQWLKHRFDVTNVSSFTYLGSAGMPGATRIGHNLNDTMWPWNLATTPPRPNTAPGGNFPPSVLSAAPGPTPTVRTMIDFQGVLQPASRLGFDYDDVPYQP